MDDYQAQILSFLQERDNLPVALEVAKHIEALRLQLHQDFWKDLHQTLKTRLEESSVADRWIITTWRNYDEAYRHVGIQVKSVPDFKGSLLSVVFMQESPANYQLRYGLCWSKDRPDPDSKAFRTLLELSKSAGFPVQRKDIWWPTFCRLNIFPRSDEFVLQYGIRHAEFIKEIVKRIWDYFTTLESTLYQLNQELFQGK